MAGAADPLQELLERVGRVARDSQGLLAELVANERRFRALAKAVWQVQEEERRRLARELHDGLGQDLTALKNQLELIRREAEAGGSEALAGRLGGAVELASRALHDTRELSRLLRPPILDDLGLVPALAWLARTLGETAGLEVRFASHGVAGRLDPELEILVFRVAQEALTNVLKHSGTRSAVLLLRRQEGWLEIEISDAGAGFDSERAMGVSAAELEQPERLERLEPWQPAAGARGSGAEPRGFGLRGMRDRLELFGGRLRIRSARGEGTRLTAVVPMPAGEGTREERAGAGGERIRQRGEG